jgi:voltage-gated potassium channel
LEPYLDFPDEWYLQPLFFLLPIVGLGAVANSIVRLDYLMLTRKDRLPEWQRMVASLHRNHVIVVGVGRVGYQIIRGGSSSSVSRWSRSNARASTHSCWRRSLISACR